MARFAKIIAAVAVAGMAFSASSAQAATANAKAKARILKDIKLINPVDLDFGTIVVDAAGTVTVPNTGAAATCTGLAACPTATAMGGVTIDASYGVNVVVSASNSVTLYNLADNSKTMSASLSLANGGARLMNASNTAVNVGGTLSVAATQADGVYEGTYQITVAYQ